MSDVTAQSRRIGFDGRYINDRYHGIGRYAFRLLEALVDAAPQHTFVVFTGKHADTRFDWSTLAARPNVELTPGPWPLYWPIEQLSWAPVLERSRLDLFHTPYFVAPLLADVPVVTTVHDLIFDRYPQYMPSPWYRPYYRWLMAAGLRKARRVIVVSQSTADDLWVFYKSRNAKVSVIHEGVDPEICAPPEHSRLAALRDKYQLTSPFILNVGARRPHKNLARLVEAYSRLDLESPVDLVFAGSEDPRFPDEARQAATSLGLDGRVRFLGWVPEADLPGLYRLASVLAQPSLIEGFGLPTIEAMACGTPVLASNRSSFPEVIGDAGLLVDPRDLAELQDSLQALLTDQVLAERLRAAGLQQAARFSWDAAARQTIALYNEILQESVR